MWNNMWVIYVISHTYHTVGLENLEVIVTTSSSITIAWVGKCNWDKEEGAVETVRCRHESWYRNQQNCLGGSYLQNTPVWFHPPGSTGHCVVYQLPRWQQGLEHHHLSQSRKLSFHTGFSPTHTFHPGKGRWWKSQLGPCAGRWLRNSMRMS